MYRIALAGNPNCGKTTLFNALTGQRQYVGNWAGVTVDRREGVVRGAGGDMALVDLPGIYSLSPYSMEELVARDYLLQEGPDAVINIVDGTNLERNLYLTLQLLELQKPLVVAVNMMDAVRAAGGDIDCAALSRRLGVPVLPVSARKGTGVPQLVRLAQGLAAGQAPPPAPPRYDARTQHALEEIAGLLAGSLPPGQPAAFWAGRLLEGGAGAGGLGLPPWVRSAIERVAGEYERRVARAAGGAPAGDRETMLADARYRLIAQVTAGAVKKARGGPAASPVSDFIDRVVTNRVLALPIFALVLFCMFCATFGPLGTALKGWIEWAVLCLAQAVGALLDAARCPAWTYGLLLDAVIGGVGGVLVFLPQILLLFLFLSLLEDSGYMARAAFIMDRLLRRLGLTGKSFIPLLMGFGCTTPAVMAARALDSEKDRRLTIMLTPFMSCGARLPIYALFCGVFFPGREGLVVFCLYALGLLVAVFCGLLLKNTLFRGQAAPFVMELPPYRLPAPQNLLRHLWDKCRGFLVKAGTIIFSMNVLIWALQYFTPALAPAADPAQSIFARLGAWLAPALAPLGFGTWQAAVALLCGLIAKESVVSTFSVLYAAGGGAALGAAIAAHFTPLSALSFMVFSLLYMPCIPAFVSIRREMGSTAWALGTALLQTGAAYLCALLVYQAGLLLL